MTRREILKYTGGALAALSVKAQSPAVGDIMAMLSAYMGEAANRKLPDAVVERAKHLILDTLAA